MIRFEFSELEDGNYYQLTPHVPIQVYGSGIATPPTEATRPQMCMSSTNDKLVTAYEYAVGNRPTHGTKVVGSMRDKEVSHLNGSGTILLPSSSFTTTYDSWGNILNYKLPSGPWQQSGPPLKWGDAGEVIKTLPSYEYTSSGTTYVVGISSGKWYFRYDGNVAILIAEINNPLVTYKSNGNVRFAASSRGGMRLYRREWANGVWVIRYWTDWMILADAHYTGSEQLALLAAGQTKTGGAIHLATNWQRLTLGPQEEAMDIILDDIRAAMGDTSLHLDEHPTDFGELGVECSAQLKFVDQNILLLVLDVHDWALFHKLWKNLRDTDGWRRAKHAYDRVLAGKGRWKDIPAMFTPGSSTYLFTKYAVLPTVSDCKRLFEGAKRSSLYSRRQRLHSRRVTSIEDPTSVVATHTAVLTVQCSSYPLDVLGASQWGIGEMKKWGAYPEMVNLWDILPYSFVVDWFVQFGDLFKDVDTYLYQKHYFPIDYCVMSEKWEVSKSITSISSAAYSAGASGVVDFSYYVRWISRELPLPTVSLEAEFTLGNHLVESTALVLQRL